MTGPDGSKKTGVVVEFSTLCYHLRSPGDMSPEELDEVVDFLMERIETQEKTELFHLENFHRTLERYCNFSFDGENILWANVRGCYCVSVTVRLSQTYSCYIESVC